MKEETNTQVFLEIIYDGKPVEITQEEAKELAQKGMNYNRLAEKFNSLLEDYNKLISYSEEMEQMLEGLKGENQELSKIKSKDKDIKEFNEEYPDVDVRTIDKEIIAEWEESGKPLIDIYNRFMVRKLKNQNDAQIANEKNTKASTGSVTGTPQTQTVYTDEMINNMTDKEIVKNFKSILKQYK